jgi:hypothetical protein
MFFPYDVFEPDINCQNFGAVTVHTARLLRERDNAFIIGRDLDYKNALMSGDGVYA